MSEKYEETSESSQDLKFNFEDLIALSKMLSRPSELQSLEKRLSILEKQFHQKTFLEDINIHGLSCMFECTILELADADSTAVARFASLLKDLGVPVDFILNILNNIAVFGYIERGDGRHDIHITESGRERYKTLLKQIEEVETERRSKTETAKGDESA